MPPLLCPCPIILDQSFPRDPEELGRAKLALGLLQLWAQEGTCLVLVSDILSSIANDKSWNENAKADYMDIQRILQQWYLRAGSDKLRVVLDSVTGYVAHPAPLVCSSNTWLQFWQDELGRLLWVYRNLMAPPGCIGIADSSACAGELPLTYGPGEKFDNGGESLVSSLSSIESYPEARGARVGQLTPNLAKRNMHLIGGTVRKANKSSHAMALFPNGRTWPVDEALSEIPLKYIRELVEITGLPVRVIQRALVDGVPPSMACRIPQQYLP